MGLRSRMAALLGISSFQTTSPRASTVQIDDSRVERSRHYHGGQLAPPPKSQTRWYLKDIEIAEREADAGNINRAARLMRAAKSDGTYSGVLSTRTSGLVRLPIQWRGDDEIVRALGSSPDSARSVFSEMFPASELALLAADGIELGVGVAEMMPVQGRSHPTMVRLNPQYLWYSWDENRWYYRSREGLLPITPGDGRWVLHIPGGRQDPWQNGLWRAIGEAFIRKSHAKRHKDNWESKLANPARVATAPLGASEQHSQAFFQKVLAWGVNTVFGLRPGYDVKIVESNGRGHESFETTIEDSNNEYKMAICGQMVTSDGGAGFQNSDIHRSIRADLIEATADTLAHTINTQGLPAWVYENFGADALDNGVAMSWNITPPKDLNSEAAAMTAASGAIISLTESLANHGLAPDAKAIAVRFGVPLSSDATASKPALRVVS